MRTSFPVLLAAAALAAAACTADVSPDGSYAGGSSTPAATGTATTGAPTSGTPTGDAPSADPAKTLTFRLTGTVKPFTATLSTDGAKETFRDVTLPWTHQVDGTADSYELEATPGAGDLTCAVLDAKGGVITQSAIGGDGGGHISCGVSS